MNPLYFESQPELNKKIDSLGLKWDLEQKYPLQLLDQTLLPQQELWLKIESKMQMIQAIKQLKVRGAPLIGISASLFLAYSALCLSDQSVHELLNTLKELREARPTAVNLHHNLDSMAKALNTKPNTLLKTALQIAEEDQSSCERMSENGASLIQDGFNILTHCNTGGLATVGIGTALGVIRKAYEQKKRIHVYVDETRPLLQGARLTAWELKKLGIPYTLITDNMAAHLMSLGKIDCAFVGCDRIARNGDFANKIGTYSIAVSCYYHQIPFYVVGPKTTFDENCLTGKDIIIEERIPQEVRGARGSFGDIQWAPLDANVYNPSFDVTPAKLITNWIMDTGINNFNRC